MVKIMENPIKMDDLGVPLFLETPISSFGEQKLYKSLLWKPHMRDRKKNMKILKKAQSSVYTGCLIGIFINV